MRQIIIKSAILSLVLSVSQKVLAQQSAPIDSVTTTRTITTTERPLSNIVVTSTGNLTVNSLGNVILEWPFEVKIGGVLEIHPLEPIDMVYIYDNSGNRIVRRLDN